MPTASAAVSGDFIPTPFRTHHTKSGKPLETVRPPTPVQVNTDLSTVENVPSVSATTTNSFYSSSIFKYIVIPLVVVSACAALAVPLGVNISLNTTTPPNTTETNTDATTIITTISTNGTNNTSNSNATTVTTNSSATTAATTTIGYTCNPSCVQGNCTSSNICTCITGWYGSNCSTPNCTSPCQNGGTCVAVNVCNCTSAWTGSVCQTAVKFFLGFDGTLQDSYNNFNGISNGTSYVSPGYNGLGSCLWLNRTIGQFAIIQSPFLNLIRISFTFEVWIYPQTLCLNVSCTDNGIIGQSENITIDRTLHFIIRSKNVRLGFYSDDLSGSQTLIEGQWYHLAFVYDYSVRTQYIYVNGYLDGIRTNAGPYLGQSGALTIGTSAVYSPNSKFDGCLDSLSYLNRAKNATEILDDATLVARLSFDGNSLVDSGPLSINGTGTSYTFTSSGRVNSALTLSGSSSFIQITGLVRLGINGWPFSFAIWVQPTNLTGGTILHVSRRTDGSTGGWCLPMMGLTSSGQIATNSWNLTNVPLTGPQLTLNTWTHVVLTYSPTNGQRLYVNGTLRAFTGAYVFSSSGLSMTVTVGSSIFGLSCNTGTIRMGQFNGGIDEFYVYSRELTASEVITLANP